MQKENMMTSVALTIAGSDPSGGAGIQADLKTFQHFGVYGSSAITLVTVQNTVRVSRVEILPADLVAEQIAAVIEDLSPSAIKTGALGNEAVMRAVAGARFSCRLVVDPVMISKHGARLMDKSAQAAFTALLLPLAELVTPNLQEAAELAGMEVHSPDNMREAAKRIADLGPGAVLVKGGHLEGEALDILYHQGVFQDFPGARYNTPHTHGTGCTYSAAITALRAQGVELAQAVYQAKRYMDGAIRTAPGLGHGNGPVNHGAPL